MLGKGFPADGPVTAVGDPHLGACECMPLEKSRLIKISLLPSVSVLAVLFPLVLVEKDLIVAEPQSIFFHLDSVFLEEPLLESRVCLNPPKAAVAHPRAASLAVHRVLGRLVPGRLPCFLLCAPGAASSLISPPVLFTQTCFSDRELIKEFSLRCR